MPVYRLLKKHLEEGAPSPVLRMHERGHIPASLP